MKKIQYTSLCHYPSLVSPDCITLAILFYIKSENRIVLESIRNWRRLKSFNDELDMDLIKLQLEGIREELDEFVKEKKFVLKEYTKFFINDLVFQPIIEVEVEDEDDFIQECKRQYLIGDMSLNKRPSVDEQIKFIKNYLKKTDVNYNGNIKGYFEENIDFDLQINNYLFKSFCLKGKNENRIIHSVKEWAYDAYKLNKNYNVVFITDVSKENYSDFAKVIKILQEESQDLIASNELFDYITTKAIGQMSIYEQ